MILTEDVKHLFHLVRVALGAPIRSIELTDDQLCALLEIAIGDYAEKVQNWVLETQWLNVQGKNTIQFQNPNELAYAMTVRTMDWSRNYSYWFSREIGLQQRGSYELKKDFFQVEKGKQVYVIPKGREINKVMYVTPSTTKAPSGRQPVTPCPVRSSTTCGALTVSSSSNPCPSPISTRWRS